MTAKPSGRQRHSFIQFYMADWLAGTARMPRLARSIYFDVCVYNWDKAAHVPRAELQLMVSDLEPEQANFLVQNLIDTGKLIENEDGSVYSERAMAEAERALAAWAAKSRGGSKGGKSAEGKSEHSSKTAPQNQSQNQSHRKKGEADASPKEGGGGEGEKPKAKAKTVYDHEGIASVAAAWNTMAVTCGLKQVAKITEERKKRLNARIGEHGADKIIEAIKTVPESRFLTGHGERGWKANIDWLLQPESCAKLVEGVYHNEGEGRSNAWMS